MPPLPLSTYNTLIRTHHITSRKKLARVRRAAAQHDLPTLLIRSGGCPGIMFAESPCENQLKSWVSYVQGLRYKDFRCVAKPAIMDGGDEVRKSPAVEGEKQGRDKRSAGSDMGIIRKEEGPFWETGCVNEFRRRMEMRGLGEWFNSKIFS